MELGEIEEEINWGYFWVEEVENNQKGSVKPDRVVFNALISACGQSGAVDRAFDVLAEMRAETIPVDPDHVTVGALIKACANAGQVDRAQEVYNMINKYNIRGTLELYTIAVNSSSLTGDWEFACNVYNDIKEKGVIPDEWLRRSNHAYGITELNAIRIKWAKYFMKKHAT